MIKDKFCRQCGVSIHYEIPPGDNRERAVCQQCGIFYENPKMVVGSLPIWSDGRILLCKRAIEPRYGQWTLPAGFMENGETTKAAAQRETEEEANASISIIRLYSLIDLPHINQLYMIFTAQLLNLDFSPGEESLAVALFAEKEIPWDDLAFESIKKTLLHYFANQQQAQATLYHDVIDKG